LRAIVERIEHIDEEIRELNEGKKEIYLEAKGNASTSRFARGHRVRQQDQEERDEQESLLDVYMQASRGRPRRQKLLDQSGGARRRNPHPPNHDRPASSQVSARADPNAKCRTAA